VPPGRRAIGMTAGLAMRTVVRGGAGRHRPETAEPRARARLRGDRLAAREHDLATAPEVSDAIRAVDGNVLIDLSDCSFLDSTVIGVLFAANLELERARRFLEVVVPRANAGIARTLELVRMRDAIVVHEVRPSHDRESSTGT
jgi:anti-anti-sigma regulatory factor